MAKRANGEGSIFKRKDGTWSAVLSYRDDCGALKRRTVYGRTQAEVRTKFRDVQAPVPGRHGVDTGTRGVTAIGPVPPR